MENDLLRFIINSKAIEWLEQNPERLNSEETKSFLMGLREYLNKESETMDDEVFDFLVDMDIIKQQRREVSFASYLNKKYDAISFKSVLDVGAGRMCRLSTALAKYGFELTAIDPKIRLTQREVERRKIVSAKKELFLSDDFAKNKKGTDISKFNLVVGLEPCDATEHIIRQCLKYDKPFDILLCAAPHDALDGKKFNSYKKWYEHLKSISSEVKIIKDDKASYATNYEFGK